MVVKRKVPNRGLRCTTHHACPCQTYRLEEAESTLRVIHTWCRCDIQYGIKTNLQEIADICDVALNCLGQEP